MNTTRISILAALLLLPGLSSRAGELSVDLTCKIPSSSKAMEDVVVVARLYEYDPLLADVGADEVDRVTISGLDLSKSVETVLRLPLGAERTERRSYYLTVFIHPDDKSKKRLYYIDGFQKVCEKKDVESVEVTLKRVSR